MPAVRYLRVAIDSAGASAGASKFTDATTTVVQGAKKAEVSVETLDKSLGALGKSAAIHAVGTKFSEAADKIVRSAKKAEDSVEGLKQRIASLGTGANMHTGGAKFTNSIDQIERDAKKARRGSNAHAVGSRFPDSAEAVDRTARKAEDSVDRLERRFGALGKTANTHSVGMFRAAKAMDKAGAAAAVVSKKIGGIGLSAKQIIGPIGLAFGAFAVVRSVIMTIGRFEESMLTLSGVTGAAADTMQRLEDTALKAGATTRFTASESAEALLFLARAGFSADESISALGATQDLASVGMISVGEAADFASNLVKQFGLNAVDTSRVVDSMTNVSNNANTSVLQLAEAMKYAGPIANSAGIDLETAAAAIGVLGDSGIQASLAGTNLRGVILALAKPTSEARRELVKMGLSFKDVDPVRVGLVDSFKALSEAQLDLTASGTIFGRRNAGAALILADSIAGLEKLEDKQRKGIGAAEDMADKIEGGLLGKFRALGASVEGLVLKIDKHVGGGGSVVDGLTASVNGLADAGDRLASHPLVNNPIPNEKEFEKLSDKLSEWTGGPTEDERKRKRRLERELAEIGREAKSSSSRANFDVYFDSSATKSNIDNITDELVALQEAYSGVVSVQNKMHGNAGGAATEEYRRIITRMQTPNRVPGLSFETKPSEALEGIARRIDDVSFALDMLDEKHVRILDEKEASSAIKELNSVREALSKHTKKIDLEIELVGMSADERERFIAGMRLEKDLRGQNADLIERAKTHLDDSIVSLQAERKAVDDSAKALKKKADAEMDAADLQDRLNDQRDRVVANLEREASLIGLSSREREIQLTLMDAGVQRYTAEGDAIEELTGRLIDLNESEQLARDFGDAWGNAFGQIATEARNGKDALRIFLEQMQQFAISQAASGVSNMFGNFFASFVQQPGAGGGVPAAGGGLNGSSLSITPGITTGNRLGGLFGADGPVNRLALGGFTGRLLTGPQEFMDAGGGRNVAGEAGEEVVMQVARDSRGRMGVRAVGGDGGGGGDTYVTNINIKAENHETFRRNRRSIARHEGSRRRR